jgi:hypothetical protein
MNRRIAIRNMALIMGSAALLPACLSGDKGKPIVELKHLKLDAAQENLVSNLCETILPKTSTPGAKDLGINLFVFKMIDDCFDKKGQDDFMAGLKQFGDIVNERYGKSFNELTVAERTDFVQQVDKGGVGQKFLDFYNVVKGQTVFGYTTSQYFMTKQIVYELIPGRYNAMFPVKKKAAV